MKYEYKAIKIGGSLKKIKTVARDIEKTSNEYANNGYELDKTLFVNPGIYILIFRKEVE